MKIIAQATEPATGCRFSQTHGTAYAVEDEKFFLLTGIGFCHYSQVSTTVLAHTPREVSKEEWQASFEDDARNGRLGSAFDLQRLRRAL